MLSYKAFYPVDYIQMQSLLLFVIDFTGIFHAHADSLSESIDCFLTSGFAVQHKRAVFVVSDTCENLFCSFFDRKLAAIIGCGIFFLFHAQECIGAYIKVIGYFQYYL